MKSLGKGKGKGKGKEKEKEKEKELVLSEEEQQRVYLRTFSLIGIFAFGFGSSLSAIQLADNPRLLGWLIGSLVLAALGVSVCSFSYWCSRQRRSSRLLSVGSWACIGYINATVCYGVYLYGSLVPLACGFMLPIICSLFLLSGRAVVLLSLVGILTSVSIYMVEALTLYQAPLVTGKSASEVAVVAAGHWVLLLVCPTLVGSFLAGQIRKNSRLAALQNGQIATMYQDILAQKQVGAAVSVDLKEATSHLRASANGQSVGSQQQAHTTLAVRNFVGRLSAGSAQTCLKAQNIAQEASQILAGTLRVQALTAQAALTSEQGLRAVQTTLASNERMGEVYAVVTQRLDELQQKSHRLTKITRLVLELSDTMHLLSLNAAIEAAGAGQYGERFGVVAQEVKALADRSIVSSKEIAQILGELTLETAHCATTAKSGSSEAETALLNAKTSGQVISELAGVVKSSSEMVEQIGLAAEEMSSMTESILTMTGEQAHSSKQAVSYLQEISAVAELNAQASLVVSDTAHRLETLSQRLGNALAGTSSTSFFNPPPQQNGKQKV